MPVADGIFAVLTVKGDERGVKDYLAKGGGEQVCPMVDDEYILVKMGGEQGKHRAVVDLRVSDTDVLHHGVFKGGGTLREAGLPDDVAVDIGQVRARGIQNGRLRITGIQRADGTGELVLQPHVVLVGVGVIKTVGVGVFKEDLHRGVEPDVLPIDDAHVLAALVFPQDLARSVLGAVVAHKEGNILRPLKGEKAFELFP